MMKPLTLANLKRSFWLLAWGVWLWLGLGLYRELPRELGPVVCQLDVQSDEEFDGFFRGEPCVVTHYPNHSTGGRDYRRWNAETGELEATINVDGGATHRWSFEGAAWHGIVVGSRHPKYVKASTEGASGYFAEGISRDVAIWDLRTGERRDFRDLGFFEAWHVNRPWLLFYTLDAPGGDRIVVLDFQTGKRVCEIAVPSGKFRHGWRPQFVGDFVALPVSDAIAFRRWDLRTEIRAIPSGGIVATIPTFGGLLVWTEDGKLAWDFDDQSNVYRLEVYDAASGRRLLTDETANPATFEGVYYTTTFSRDGRFVLSPGTGTVFDLPSGERRWQARSHERLLFAAGPGLFEVAEEWTLELGGWEWPIATTFALRRLTDGCFAYRAWRSISTSTPSNEKRTLCWDDGVIRRLPPVVDWPFLAVCQTILALPLVLLWSILRWRKRRAARRRLATI